MAKILVVLLVGLGLAVAFTAWRAARREANAEAKWPPEGRIIDVDGTRIHAVVMGTGPDLVLIHGSSGNTRDMTFSLAPRLASHYRVIVFDRPGLGYTDRLEVSGATIVRQADLLMRAARQLGAKQPIVMGHSYGGAVALAWAVRHPRALSALVPVAAASNPWPTPLDLYYRVTSSRLGSALVVPLITAFVPTGVVRRAVEATFAPQNTPAGYGDHFGARLALRRTTSRENARQRANLLAEIEVLHRQYGDIAVPTEIVHGTADPVVSVQVHSQRLTDQIPGAVLTRLDGIGHMAHQVAQGAVVAAINRAAARAGLR